MANVNKIILIGNLTRDPELRHLPSQMAVCDFGLAINRTWKNANGEKVEEVCFIDCTAFGKTGEIIHQYSGKGKQLYVDGYLKLDSWDDKNGGGKRSKHKVVVENFQFIGGPGDDAPKQQSRQPRGTQHQDDSGSFGKEDIPF